MRIPERTSRPDSNRYQTHIFETLWRRRTSHFRCQKWLVWLLLVGFAYAQPSTSLAPASNASLSPNGPYVFPSQVPSVLLAPYFALGDRLSKPGNERITLQGTLTTSSGPSNVLIVLEVGGKLNITWSGGGAQRLVFNGNTPPAISGIPNANDLLGAFVDDLAETLIFAGRSASPRPLGQKFADPSGGFCDYYDVATSGDAVRSSKPLIKRYCFDSRTSLLKSVRYYSNSQLNQTEFGGWATVNQQAVLGIVTRKVAGIQVFHFQAHASVVSPGIPDNTFKP